jgi:hypothetical protein
MGTRMKTGVCAAIGICSTCIFVYSKYKNKKATMISTIMGNVKNDVLKLPYTNIQETYLRLLDIPIFHRPLVRMRVLCNIPKMETTFSHMLISLLSFVVLVLDMEKKPSPAYMEALHKLENKAYKNTFLCKQELFKIEAKLAWDIENSFKLLTDTIAQLSESISHRHHRYKYTLTP